MEEELLILRNVALALAFRDQALSALYFAVQPDSESLAELLYRDPHELFTKTLVFVGVPAKSTMVLRNGFKSGMESSSFSAEFQL